MRGGAGFKSAGASLDRHVEARFRGRLGGADLRMEIAAGGGGLHHALADDEIAEAFLRLASQNAGRLIRGTRSPAEPPGVFTRARPGYSLCCT